MHAKTILNKKYFSIYVDTTIFVLFLKTMESKLWGWYNKFFMTWQYHLIWLKIGNKTFFPINNSNDTKLVNFIIVRWYQNSKHYWSFLFPCGSCCKTNIPVSNDRHCVIRWCRFFKCFFFHFFETKEIDKMWQISHHEPLFLLTCWPICPMSHHPSPAQVTPVRRRQCIESFFVEIFEGFGGILNLNLPERTLVLMNANITIYPWTIHPQMTDR